MPLTFTRWSLEVCPRSIAQCLSEDQPAEQEGRGNISPVSSFLAKGSDLLLGMKTKRDSTRRFLFLCIEGTGP